MSRDQGGITEVVLTTLPVSTAPLLPTSGPNVFNALVRFERITELCYAYMLHWLPRRFSRLHESSRDYRRGPFKGDIPNSEVVTAQK